MTKRGEKFASARADWTKNSNISQIYDVIYNIMVEARIASERPEPVFTDRRGNEVEKSERCKISITEVRDRYVGMYRMS